MPSPAMPLLLLLSLLALLAATALSAPAAAAPKAAPAPPASPTKLMSGKGCKAFVDLLTATADGVQTFESSVGGGLTVFCPVDQAVKSFMPKYKNLTADGKLSLLLYHGVPVYYTLQMLKNNNGVMNTLATDGTAKNFNFTIQNVGEQVTVKTQSSSVARVTGTIADKDPLALYTIDSVLEPLELFKPVEAPAPAPAPDSSAAADAPKSSKKKKKHAPAPAGPDEQPSDENAADQNGGRRHGAGSSVAAAAAAAVAASLLLALVA